MPVENLPGEIPAGPNGRSFGWIGEAGMRDAAVSAGRHGVAQRSSGRGGRPTPVRASAQLQRPARRWSRAHRAGWIALRGCWFRLRCDGSRGDACWLLMASSRETTNPASLQREQSLLSRWIESQRQLRHRYPLAVAIVVLVTGVDALLFPIGDTENLVMVYLLGVVVAAIRLGQGPAVVATVGGFASFVYFFVPHYYSFMLADLYHLPTFVIMLAVALVVSTLTSKVRTDAASLDERERRSRALYELSRDLAAAESRSQIAEVVQRHLALAFGCGGRIVERAEGRFVPFEPGAAQLSDQEKAQCEVALLAGRVIDCGGGIAQPLVVANETVGLLRCDGLELEMVKAEASRQLLESFANNVAVAMHRVVVGERAMLAVRRVEEERVRNVMLSSVSHDLRTPLASITGAATTILDAGAAIDESTRLDLLESIREDADALERHVRNMLDITRLEAGGIVARRDWHSVEEVVGCAIRRVETLFTRRKVTIAVDQRLPLVSIDELLVEQMLVNLLENAAKYSPEGSPIDIDVRFDEGQLRIAVADRGPGVAASDRERVFRKFERGVSKSAGHGAGLGLAICRAVAQLHGGDIVVSNRVGGGAEFVASLPCEVASLPRIPAEDLKDEDAS
jgi:two-component system sensor histidine kinase KdpD